MDHDARSFITALGGYRSVATALSKRGTTVHVAMQSGTFPAAWYDALCKLASQADVTPPSKSLFSFLQLCSLSKAGDGAGCNFNSGDRFHERAS